MVKGIVSIFVLSILEMFAAKIFANLKKREMRNILFFRKTNSRQKRRLK
jgi:hypothetical protein